MTLFSHKIKSSLRPLLLLALASFILGAFSACSPAAISLPDAVQLKTGVRKALAGPALQPQPTAVPGLEETPEGNHVSTAEERDEEFLVIEEIIIGLLLIAVIVGIVAQRFRLPYTAGLVLIGLALTLGVELDVSFPPNLILALLVPPLIFEAAFHLNFSDLRYSLIPILALAVPGVILTTLLVGVIIAWGTNLPLALALVFGALVSATDPVSVVALFRSMGVPHRLQVLLEGESLLNDGTAIVIFDLVIVLAIKGIDNFNLVSSLVSFVRVAGGGLVVGIILGAIISQMISRIDDYLIETTLTSVLAYGAYLVAETLGVSGVLAVVAAGLINGNIGPKGMSPTTRIVVYNFWEYAGFLANSFIFLLIGLRINLTSLFDNWQLILWAIAAVLVARAIGVYTLSRLGQEIPLRWQHVLYWGGLRGAISLALALSLPLELGTASSQIQVMAFGVVLFTLLVPGFTMGSLVRRMGLVERSESQEEYERRHARAVASRAAYEHLERRNRQGLLSDHTWKTLAPLLEEHNKTLVNAVREVLTSDPSVEAEELDTARRESLRAQRSAINNLLKDGVISEDAYSQLIAEVDAAITGEQKGWQEIFGIASEWHSPVNRLMAAVVQDRDVENAISALTKLGISVTCLPSTGGFLRRRNTTLLIGLSHGHEEAAVKALNKSCSKRVEYLASPPDEMEMVLPAPTQITVGGATLFTFEVERFEVF